MPKASNRTLVSNAFIATAIATLVLVYFLPIWWVSLTAPNYPEEAFPDGVRINFHMNGVFNGCKKVDKVEITETEALNCVHEMDTINHYVGMYPIAAGGVVERAFSPFLVSLLIVMLIGFMFSRPKIRLLVMSLGFGAIAVWMGLTWYGENGLKYQSVGYMHAMVAALDQDTEKESSSKIQIGFGMVERLKDSLEESGVVIEGYSEQAGTDDGLGESEKAENIRHLQATYENYMKRQPSDQKQAWTGSSSQMMAWHYKASLGRYFNNPAEILPMVKTMGFVGQLVFWGIIGAMLLLLWGARKNKGLLYWLLIVVPMALPVFFLIEYSAWLWWYGHQLNEMGAFTVKPFMPTVFGQGKVAQFTTHSYPAIGFGLMLLSSVLLGLAFLMRRKQGKLDSEATSS
jgi:hypothetical protein